MTNLESRGVLEIVVVTLAYAVVRACLDARAATDALIVVNKNDAVFVPLIRSAGWAHGYARRIVAVLASDRQKGEEIIRELATGSISFGSSDSPDTIPPDAVREIVFRLAG